MNSKHDGLVKWFSQRLGFGFIGISDEIKKQFSLEATSDLFVHVSGIAGSRLATLQPGDQVEFEVEPGPRGPRAVNVRVLNHALNHQPSTINR